MEIDGFGGISLPSGSAVFVGCQSTDRAIPEARFTQIGTFYRVGFVLFALVIWVESNIIDVPRGASASEGGGQEEVGHRLATFVVAHAISGSTVSSSNAHLHRHCILNRM